MRRAFALLAAGALPAAACAASGGFSFRSIEFAPADQRLSAARALVRDAAASGTPLPVALAAMRRAEAACSRRPAADGAIRCQYARVASDSLNNLPLGDVTWTVRIFPTSSGTVERATVDRVRIGN